MENIIERGELFKKLRKSCMHVEKNNYKEARNERQKLIRTKKNAYFERKLTGNIGKPMNLCERKLTGNIGKPMNLCEIL